MMLLNYFLLLFTLPVFISAQNLHLRFINFTGDDEFCNSSITSIFQDRYGFMWFVTPEGLIRYDGYTFKDFDFERMYQICFPDTIQGEEVFILKSGQYKMNPGNFKINPVKDKNGNQLQSTSVAKDSHGIYWCLSQNLFFGFDPETGDTLFRKPLEVNRLTRNILIANDQVWYSTNQSVICHDIRSGKEKIYRRTELISNLFFFSDNRVAFFSGNNTLKVFNSKDDCFSDIVFQYPGKSIGRINSVALDKDYNIWLATSDGLLKYISADNRIIQYTHNSANLFSLKTNNILSVFVDVNNVLWIGTNTNGIAKCHITGNRIGVIDDSDPNNGLPDKVVNCLSCDSKGIIWIGTDSKGLARYNPATGNIQYIPGFKSNKQDYIVTQISTVAVESDDIIWVGSWSYGLFRIDVSQLKYHENASGDVGSYCKVQGFFPSVDSTVNALSGWSVRHVFIDSDRTVWIAADGLNRYKEGQFSRFLNRQEIKKYKSIKSILTSESLLPGRLIVAFEFGIFYLEKQGAKEGAIEIKGKIEDIQSVLTDGSGFLWILSHSKLRKAYLDTQRMEMTITDSLDLSGMHAVNMNHGADQSIWITTIHGLLKTDAGLNNLIRYDAGYGIPTSRFQSILYDSARGMMYSGSASGLVFFDPKSIKTTRDSYPIRFTRYLRYGKEVLPGDTINGHVLFQGNLNNTKSITLRHTDNDFTLEFAGLSYQSNAGMRYDYMMTGYDKQWRTTDPSIHSVTYANLPAGSYTFQVKFNGSPDSPVSSINFLVLAPWWNTWWFRISILLTISLMVYLFFNYRLRSIKKQRAMLENDVKLRTAEILSQKEDLQIKSENLQEINSLLAESKEEIELQAAELAEINQELNKLNASKDKFFSIIAHDLKNPFYAIIGLSELLVKDIRSFDTDKLLQFVTMINSSATASASLLENLLQWATTQTKKVKFTPAITNIFSITEETISLLALNAQKKAIKISNITQEQDTAYVDVNMIKTIIRNILSNAIKFTSEGGQIDINSASKDDDFITVSIKDNGVGMDPSKLNDLFRIDKQNSTDGTSGEKGTGLGLLICSEFIKLNNGSIEVESSPGKGTTFIITLPKEQGKFVVSQKTQMNLSAEQNETNSGSESTTVNAGLEKSETEVNPLQSNKSGLPVILIVEDSNELRMNLYHQFKDNYNVLIAKNGEEGLDLVMDIIPDIVISDVMMPILNGYELCDKIKNDIRTSHIPIILLTAKATEESQIDGYKAGADDYIPKPCNFNILSSKVSNIIKARKLLREKFSQSLRSDEMTDFVSTSIEKSFIDKVNQYIENHIAEPDLDGDHLASHLNISKGHLYKKMNSLTNQTVNEYIRSYRLKKSLLMLKTGNRSISEIAYEIGFNSPTYFTRCFKEQYGISPRQYNTLK